MLRAVILRESSLRRNVFTEPGARYGDPRR